MKKKIVIFSEDEFDKIREFLLDMKSDIWDLNDSQDRSVMFNDLYMLEKLLLLDKEVLDE